MLALDAHLCAPSHMYLFFLNRFRFHQHQLSFHLCCFALQCLTTGEWQVFENSFFLICLLLDYSVQIKVCPKTYSSRWKTCKYPVPGLSTAPVEIYNHALHGHYLVKPRELGSRYIVNKLVLLMYVLRTVFLI